MYFEGMFRVCHALLSVHCNREVTCWERTNLLVLLYVMFICVLSLSYVVSWTLSIPDICLLTYYIKLI